MDNKEKLERGEKYEFIFSEMHSIIQHLLDNTYFYGIKTKKMTDAEYIDKAFVILEQQYFPIETKMDKMVKLLNKWVKDDEVNTEFEREIYSKIIIMLQRGDNFEKMFKELEESLKRIVEIKFDKYYNPSNVLIKIESLRNKYFPKDV